RPVHERDRDPWPARGRRPRGQGQDRVEEKLGQGRRECQEGQEHARREVEEYRRVWVIGRTLATDEKDQHKAYKLMKQYKLKRNGKPRKFSKNCKPGEPGTFPTPTDGPRFISALNQALADNPPPARDDPLLDQLKPLGIGPGLSPES